VLSGDEVLVTPFTRQIGIGAPIVQAPIGGLATPRARYADHASEGFGR
jgi:hypothetical protein